MKINTFYNEDCKETMKRMDENSIPFIITDPPYLLEFMGKDFDKQHHLKPGINMGQKMQAWHEEWLIEAFRILKPGGFLVAFGGSRTSHRLASAMEDVGFEIRDTMMWLYGSGFPKSYNISKGIGKHFGKEREVVGKTKRNPNRFIKFKEQDGIKRNSQNENITKPDPPESEKWEGFGTALKPAFEPIIIGMKPIDKNFVNNALNHGVAGINVDAGRINTTGTIAKRHLDNTFKLKSKYKTGNKQMEGWGINTTDREIQCYHSQGRFPANLILTHHPECEYLGEKKIKAITGGQTVKKTGFGKFGGGKEKVIKEDPGYGDEQGNETVENWNCHPNCPIRILDEQSGVSISNKHSRGSGREVPKNDIYGEYNDIKSVRGHDDSGGASRFFYCTKVSKNERNLGLEDLEEKKGSEDFRPNDDGTKGIQSRLHGATIKGQNNHPTVKPISLMIYLLKIFSTPDGGLVYDPFAGSGTTLIACKILNRPYIGSELDKDYCKIISNRLKFDWKSWWKNDKKVVEKVVKVKEKSKNKFFDL